MWRRAHRLLAAVTFVLSAACSSTRVTTMPPDARAPVRMVAAEALVKAGCFECLLEAHKEYDALRSSPAVTAAAVTGAVRTAVLLAIRERELGTEDSGYLARARELTASAAPSLQQPLTGLIEIADTLPIRGAARQVGDDAELARMQAAYRNREAWTAALGEHADEDALTAYLWLAFNCAYVPAGQQAPDEWAGRLTAWRETALITFKIATCRSGGRTVLEQLMDADPRFVEINYFLAQADAFAGRIDQAMARLLRAYEWRPRWPSVTHSLANDSVAIEEFDRAIEFFDRTLDVVPAFAEALLGKVRALTYAGRYDDALAAIEPLLAGRWLVGDARYWRAFNEAQLNRNDEAWSDIELAARLLVNAEVPKLAGILAYRLKQIDVSRDRFEESRSRNPSDCETGYYLGLVLGEQGAWSRASEVLVETDRCLHDAERALNAEIASLGAATIPPERRERQIARRERQIASGRRMMATAWFNLAVVSFNLSRWTDARQYAEKVSDDEQFGERARDLLTRLNK